MNINHKLCAADPVILKREQINKLLDEYAMNITKLLKSDKASENVEQVDNALMPIEYALYVGQANAIRMVLVTMCGFSNQQLEDLENELKENI